MIATEKPILSAYQELLLVAARMRQPFTFDELGLAAWRQNPERFGNRTFPNYPDWHRTMNVFSAPKKGPFKTGKIKRDPRRPGYFFVVNPERYKVQLALERRTEFCPHGLRHDECHLCGQKWEAE